MPKRIPVAEKKFIEALNERVWTYHPPVVNLYRKTLALQRLIKRTAEKRDKEAVQDILFLLDIVCDMFIPIINFIWFFFWEEHGAKVIKDITKADFEFEPQSTDQIINTLFDCSKSVYEAVLCNANISRKDFDILKSAYETKDRELFKNVFYSLPPMQFSKEVVFLESFFAIGSYLNKASLLIDENEFESFVESWQYFFHLYLKIIRGSSTDDQENEVINRLENTLYNNEEMDTVLSSLSLSHTEDEMNIHEILKWMVMMYLCVYIILLINYGENHPYTEAFLKIRWIKKFQELEDILSEQEVDEICEKIKGIIEYYSLSNQTDLKEKIFAQSKLQSLDIPKLGTPNAYTYNSNSLLNRFLEELYSKYNSYFTNLDKSGFFYCFGNSTVVPHNYPSKIIWNGSKVDFLIFIRSLYTINKAWHMSEMFVRQKDLKKGITDWTGGNTLNEETHSKRVNGIIELAKRYNIFYNGDGIEWLRKT